MVIVDTSAWVEYFQLGDPATAENVDRCLAQDRVGIGDLVYCEVMQGIYSPRRREEISSLLLPLPHFEMVGFEIAEQAAANYRLLRSRGITVRKTIDVIIGTFCVENGLEIVHHDRDFDLMAPHIGLVVL
jgi:predicted nucleic acid-binding protein